MPPSPPGAAPEIMARAREIARQGQYATPAEIKARLSEEGLAPPQAPLFTLWQIRELQDLLAPRGARRK